MTVKHCHNSASAKEKTAAWVMIDSMRGIHLTFYESIKSIFCADLLFEINRQWLYLMTRTHETIGRIRLTIFSNGQHITGDRELRHTAVVGRPTFTVLIQEHVDR